MNLPKIVTQAEWVAARKEFLAREKEFDHERDRLTEARRKLPMVKVEKEYVFDGPQGTVTLRDLFEGRRQLIVYHFMFDPDPERSLQALLLRDGQYRGKPGPSYRQRHFVCGRLARAACQDRSVQESECSGPSPGFRPLRMTSTTITTSPWTPTEAPLSTTTESVDFRGEMPGLSVFFRDNDLILHSYSTYFRGLDMLLPMYHLLDRTPLGRQEDKGTSMHARRGLLDPVPRRVRR